MAYVKFASLSSKIQFIVIQIILQINGTWILKSGTDFRQFSVVTLDFSEDPIEVTIEAVDVTAAAFEPDNELTEELAKFSGKMDDELCKG